MGKEDYPDCIFCGQRTKWANFDNISELLTFYCSDCGQSVEVDIGIENERLLSNSSG